MFRRWAIISLTMLCNPLILFAQETYPEPKIAPTPPTVMLEWLIGAIFLVACLVVAFKPAKRSNLR